MKFQYNCIGSNIPENREHLDKLGYENDADLGLSVLATNIALGYFLDVGKSAIDFYLNEGFIDCRNNDALFQAVSAMRDDNHIHQWHIIDYDVYLDMPKDYWFIATDLSGGKHVGCQIDPMYCHKATLSELQAHFKRV